jgi:hypothetical protein
MQIRISILNILLLFISMISCAKDNTTNTKLVVTPDETYGKITLDSLPGYSQPYSSFVGFDSETSDDCFTVGSKFYIYIDRKSTSNYDFDEMYYRKVTIKQTISKYQEETISLISNN